MAKGKYYAVKCGRKPGIFLSWEECKEQVENFPNAKYKGFATREDAETYLSSDQAYTKGKHYYAVRQGHIPGVYDSWEGCKQQIDGFSNPEYRKFPDKETAEKWFSHDVRNASGKSCRAYVDGSFNANTGMYGYGVVLIFGKTEYTFSGSGNDATLGSMRNVAGELEGAMRAVREEHALGYGEITLYYKYAGIANWVTGAWKATKPGTARYKKLMQESGRHIKINFTEVKSSSSKKYMTLVEHLAKETVGQ